jgi:type IV pilus assembly protein PilQ
MKNTYIVILILAWGWVVRAQEYFPPQPYSPDELVSFTPNVPFNTALEILNSFSQRYENRIIIDSKVRTKPIGVAVEKMHWKRAFEYILRSNLLKHTRHERYYEVEDLISSSQQPEPKESEISIKSREIEINAVFFQADYETLHELGINWATFKNGTVRAETFGASSVAKDFLRVSGNGTINRTIKVEALLKLFESANKGEILARPQVRVMNGQKGKIKVGKNFYLTLQDFAGNTRFTEYEAGVILTVTPTVIGRNDSTFIHLDILAERSDVQPDAIGVTKSITEGHTQVLLLNGEETVLAGLLSHEVQNLHKGIPILKDLPLLRYVFGYNSKTVKKKELVILIEAKLVPGLLERKIMQIDLYKHLDRERQEFKKLMSPNTNGAKDSRVRRNSPAKP